MKKSNLVAEKPGGRNSNSHYQQDEELILFITNDDGTRVEGSNLKGQRLLKSSAKNHQQENLYQQIIHPSDYGKFLIFLKSCSTLEDGEKKEITVRLKPPSGNKNEFIFCHRIYKGTPSRPGKMFLITARELHKKTAVNNLFSGSEQKIHNSRDQYAFILHAMDDAFSIIDVIFDQKQKPIDYMFVEMNKAFEKHVALHEPIGKTMREFAPDHEEQWFETYGEVALSGIPTRFENIAKESNKVWFDVYALPIGHGSSSKVALFFSDITEKRIAEQQLKKLNKSLEKEVTQRTRELKENSELLQTIFDSTNEGIVVFEPIYNELDKIEDFIYIRVNKIIVEQYNSDKLTGRRFLEVNPDATEIGIFESFKRTFTSGKPEDFEIFYDRDGYNNWFRITTRRQNDLLITSLEDITQRKLEAQRLQENIRFKKHLTRASPDIILIFDLYQEKIKYVNRDLAPRKNMKKKDILGMDIPGVIPFVHPHERETILGFHKELMQAKDRDILEMEFRLRSKNKGWEWYNALGKVFQRNRKGNVCEYMVLLRNIDTHKNTQKALIDAKKYSIKGELARTLAHELRNPLASIGMAADILKKQLSNNKNKQLENYIGIIRRSTTVLNNLVTELLTSSNYSAPVLKKNCLAKIMEKTLKLASDRIYLSGIKVIKEYEGNYFIQADEEKLKIALLNLLINASEAMDPNEGVLTLQIERKKSNFLLTVTDNGCGIEKEQLERLFDAFYTQKSDGVGVGLNSVKNILEEHDAKTKVDSEPGKGTSFKISFPHFQNS